jgi:hypothetical protein
MASTLARFESSGFLPVGTPKTLVYVCQTIPNYAGFFERVRRAMMRRVEGCVESHKGHFEHLL